jgi:hypothetical protein
VREWLLTVAAALAQLLLSGAAGTLRPRASAYRAAAAHPHQPVVVRHYLGRLLLAAVRGVLDAAVDRCERVALTQLLAGQNTNARSSMLRRVGASLRELGSSNAVCAVRRARPSLRES